MEKISEKTITIQTKININFLEKFIVSLKNNPNQTLYSFMSNWQKEINWDKNENYSLVNQGVIIKFSVSGLQKFIEKFMQCFIHNNWSEI